ncbi:hypothetical protein PLESTB_000487700 [Pleodorina starrii]|uniref:C3H1-type domain-containing protein n=1 Tax=Pleodorina starrii TaxID=330485 RepID=A0A9W6BFM9_9CHLO|nr:hypothetical protein PLESTB_000487700 [Pleodorina starrii]
MATISETPSSQHLKAEAAEQCHRFAGGGAGAGGSYDDSLAESISLRPSWGRAVTRPCAAANANNTNNLLPTTFSSQPDQHQRQQQPTSAAQKRSASVMADKSSDISGPGAADLVMSTSTPTSPATALDSLTGGAWFQAATPAGQGHAAAAPALAMSGLGGRGGSGAGRRLFGDPSLLQPMSSAGGRSFGSEGGGGAVAVTAHGLSPGSPLGSGRASPATGGGGGAAGRGGSDGGGSAASFLSCSPDGSPTAVGAAPLSPFHCRTSFNGGMTITATPGGGVGGGSGAGSVPTPALPKPEPMLGSQLSHGSHGSHGSQGGGGGDSSGGAASGAGVGLGPGQVYLVVDPSTGLVVGTAQATGASTPGSLAPSTPGATGMAFHGPAGGGHTPAGTGSTRSSLDLPGSAHGQAQQLRPTSTNQPVRSAGGGLSGGTMAAADMTRAALSLLGAGGAGAGAVPAAAAAAAAAASAAAVNQQNALALASLAGGSGGGGGGEGGAAAAQAQQSTAELLMLLASAGAGAPATSAAGGGGGAMAPDTSAAAALASTLDPATAAALLDAAGVLDAAAAAAAGAQGAAAGATGVGTLPLQLPVPFPPGPGGATATGGGVAHMSSAPPGFTSALLGPAGPAVFAPGASPGAAGLPNFASGAGGAAGNAATVAAVRVGLLGNSALAGLAGLGSPGSATWRSPSWRNAGGGLSGLAAIGSPGPAVAVGARTTQAAAALAPQGLLAGLASPPGPRGTGPKHNTLYKTEMCRSWTETGSCRYGSKCQFAHGPEELRPVIRHPKYKTEHCRTFAATGACQYGSRCRFIHAVPPGSAIGTPRPQGIGLLGPEVGAGGMAGEDGASVGGGAALQSAADAAGAAVWSRSSDSGVGNGALSAAAASLLSPSNKACLFSPTGRGAARHSNSLTSPPFKMARLTEQLLPLMQLPATANGGDAAANRAVNASLVLLGGGGGGGGASMFGGDADASGGTGGGAADAALQLFSAFGRGGDPKAGTGAGAGASGLSAVPPVTQQLDASQRPQQQQQQSAGPGGAVHRRGSHMVDTVMVAEGEAQMRP